MSIKLMSQVWKPARDGGSPYKGRKLLLHLALADFAHDDGVCWPSQDTLAKKCRMSARWVTATITEMARDGYLVRVRRGGKYMGSAEYRLTFPESQPEPSTGGASPSTRTRQSINPNSAVGQPEVGSRSTRTECVQPISNHQGNIRESLLSPEKENDGRRTASLAALRNEFPEADETDVKRLADAGVAILEIPMIAQSMRETFSKPQFVTLRSFMKHFANHRADKETLNRAEGKVALDATHDRREEANRTRSVAEWQLFLSEGHADGIISGHEIDQLRERLPYDNLRALLDQIRTTKSINGIYNIDPLEVSSGGQQTSQESGLLQARTREGSEKEQAQTDRLRLKYPDGMAIIESATATGHIELGKVARWAQDWFDNGFTSADLIDALNACAEPIIPEQLDLALTGVNAGK